MEDYSILEPRIIKKSFLGNLFSRIIHCFFSENKAEKFETLFFFPSFFELRKTIKELNPDIIIYRDETLLTFIAYFSARISGIKNNILYTQKPLFKHTKRKDYLREIIKNYIKKIFLPKVRITPVYTSKFDESIVFKNFYKLDKSYFIPLVFDINKDFDIDKKPYLYGDKINIISVGKYRDYKNHFLLIDAISLLKNPENYIVRIIGQSINKDELEYYDKLKTYIKSKNLDHIIKLYKNVEYSKMSQFYTISDIFVLTSKREVASVSIIEAMAHGLVPISTNMNGTAQYINMEIGEVFTTMDANDLAKKIEKISKQNLKEIGRANYLYYKKNFTSEQYIFGLNKVIQEEFGIDKKLI